MTTSINIQATILNQGFAALANSLLAEQALALTHISLGSGVGTTGYVVDPDRVELVNERLRVSIAEADSIANRFLMNALFDEDSLNFPVHEIGFYAGDDLFAIASKIGEPYYYRNANTIQITMLSVLFLDVPEDSLTINISGPNLQLLIIKPFIQTANTLIKLIRRSVQSDIAIYTPIIEAKWR